MKRPGEVVKLRAAKWEGPAPEAWDYLRTRTGRLYVITSVRGKILECRVLDANVQLDPGAKVFNWYWLSRHAGSK